MTKQELYNKYGDEQVAVVDTEVLLEILKCTFQQLDGKSEFMPTIATLWNKRKFVFRRDAEYNDAFKQLVSNVIVWDGERIFTLFRISGEERLKRKRSIGIGGHVSPQDMTLENAAWRELCEEIEVPDLAARKLNLEGMMFLGDSPVSRDHICLTYTLLCDVTKIRVKETNKLEGVVMSPKQISTNIDEFDGWSKYLYYTLMNKRLH